MRGSAWLALTAFWLLEVPCAPAAESTLRAWPVDPHVKVFRDTAPAEGGTGLSLRAARNEFEPAQLAVRSTTALQGLRIEVSPLRHADGRATLGPDHVRWNFIGYIPLAKNTRGSEAVRVRAAPCEVPDPLLEARSMDLAANTTQPVWLTVFVPKDATPGVYRGEVTASAGPLKATLPIELSVDPFVLPDARHVLVTNWFNLNNLAKAHQVEMWSEPFWAVLERYARNMAAHRQNVVLVPWSLVAVTRQADGKLAFDYGRFDRFVELFAKCGVADRIEIGHVGGGKDGWGTEFQLSSLRATDQKTGKPVTLAPEEGVLRLVADLEQHLAARGWLERSMIHVGDEPILTNLDSWRKISDQVRKAAPRLRRIEAIETIDCAGALEVWVPQLIHFDRWREAYEARRSAGEFWFYICCNPYGSVYPNRFLDYPLSRVRVLHWMNFSEDLAGYLHWGLNFWGKDPFGTPSDRLPPGDTHVIYPGSQGPLDSMRWEIQRESLEDFEYLHLLVAQTEAVKQRLGKGAEWVRPRRRALELARRVVPAISATELDPARITAVRRQVADEIVSLGQSPLVLMETEPAEGTTLVEGPIAVEVRGVCEPGTTIRVNGRAVKVGPDGRFVARPGA
ncbi:MAG: DUF4091 domain-containing protein, partial [Thermoguttaceae bacterium]|nr:DUF4091 domain-containing protein [Thermoguttaceae bacterium]